MAKNTKRKVLAEGATVEIIGGKHRYERGIVGVVAGSPVDKRTVTVYLIGGGTFICEQHNLKVLKGPERLPKGKPYHETGHEPGIKEPKLDHFPIVEIIEAKPSEAKRFQRQDPKLTKPKDRDGRRHKKDRDVNEIQI